MARDRDIENDEDLGKHPALKNFNRTGFKVNHIAGETLKGAGTGAVVGAIGLPLVLGAVTLLTGPIGWAVGAGALVTGATSVGGLALTGATVGGGLWGLKRLVSSASDADEKADEREEKLTTAYERLEMREERADALAMKREQMRILNARQKQALGISPGHIPGGKGTSRTLA